MIPAIYSNSRNSNGFLPSLFNDIFNDSWLMPVYQHTTTPAINVSEDDNEFKLEVAAPGMNKEDFHITLNNDDLVISMEKKSDNKDEADKKKYIRREFSYSKFEQRLTLPENVERKNISAKMTDGVLCIELPKVKPEEKANEAQYIEIK